MLPNIDPMDLIRGIANGGGAPEAVANHAANEAKRQERVSQAALIVEMLATPAGKLLREQIEKMAETYIQPPEKFTFINDQNRVCVNEFLVAKFAGGREVLNSVLLWFNGCGNLIQEEAKRKQSGTGQAPP
jgi:hypothetical protein